MASRLGTSLCLGLVLAVARIQADCPRSLTTASGPSAPTGPLCQNQLIFEDNFDNLNLNTWNHEVNMQGGGNGEFQWYTDSPRNSFTENGVLKIKPTLTTDVIPDLTNCQIHLQNCNAACDLTCSAQYIAPPVQSARITTSDKFSFKYGRVEIRAKLPTGDWLWPAMWLIPQNNTYGGWPRSGEIDLLEARGNLNYKPTDTQIGAEQFATTLHFGQAWYNSAWWSSNFAKNSPAGQGYNQDFHVYQLDWSPDAISLSLDNQLVGSIPTGEGFYKRGLFTGENPWANGALNAPFDQEFFFILNVAVGGTNGFFPENGNVNGKPWANNAQYPSRDFWNGRNQWLSGWNLDTNAQNNVALQVDYIRVYAL